MIRVDLPYPHKALWPNGRAHYLAKYRQTADHHHWAYKATLAALRGLQRPVLPDRVPVHITVHPMPRGPKPDKDNCAAAAKAYLDGIADALKVNDPCFEAPIATFATPRDGRFVVEVGS